MVEKINIQLCSSLKWDPVYKQLTSWSGPYLYNYQINGEKPKSERFYRLFLPSQIFQCPTQLPAYTAPELQVRLYCFYILKVSTTHEHLFFPFYLPFQSLHYDKSRVDRKLDKGQYVYGFYIILCWNVYYSILTFFCLKLSENFNSFHFSHTISYTYLHSNITNSPLTHYIRVSSIELYVHVRLCNILRRKREKNRERERM